MSQKIKDILIKIQDIKPFILNITNYFPMDLIASGLRSIGAFSLMSNAEQEIEELLNLAQIVVINLGKLDDKFVKLSHRICQRASQTNKPVILDLVGTGISRYRTDTTISILEKNSISIVRGYSNELESLLEGRLTIPNTSSDDQHVLENAKKLSERHDMTVVISGKFNTVIDSDKMDQFNFDSSLIQKVAGIDSLLSSIIGAFHAIEKNRFDAARAAIDFYGNCVGSATSRARGPASLRMELIDKLYINSSDIYEW